MVTPSFPHPIHGTITSTSKPIDGRVVRLTNIRTGETITAITQDRGKYIADAGNFTSGYVDGDTIQLQMDTDYPYFDDTIKVTGAKIEFK